MEPLKILNAILEEAKPLTLTVASRSSLIQDFEKSGIKLDNELNILSTVTEKNLDLLIKNLNKAVMKLIVRRVMRQYT